MRRDVRLAIGPGALASRSQSIPRRLRGRCQMKAYASGNITAVNHPALSHRAGPCLASLGTVHHAVQHSTAQRSTVEHGAEPALGWDCGSAGIAGSLNPSYRRTRPSSLDKTGRCDAFVMRRVGFLT